MGKWKPHNETNSSEGDTEKQQNCIPISRTETSQKYFLLLGEVNGQKNEASLLGRPVEVSKHIAQYLLLCYSGTISSKQQGNPPTSSNDEHCHQSQHQKNLSSQAITKPSILPTSAENNCRKTPVAGNNNNTNNLKSPLDHKEDERCNPNKKFKSSVSSASTSKDGGDHDNVGRHDDDKCVNRRASTSHKSKKRKDSAGGSPHYGTNLVTNPGPRRGSPDGKNRRRVRSKSSSTPRLAKREKLSKTPPPRARRSSSTSASQKRSKTPTSPNVRTRSKSKQETNNAKGLTKSKDKKTSVPPPIRKAALGFGKTIVKTGSDNDDESIKFASDIDDESSDDEEGGWAEKKIDKPRKISNIYAKKGEKLDDEEIKSELVRSRTLSSASGSNTKNCECHCRNCRLGSIQNKK